MTEKTGTGPEEPLKPLSWELDPAARAELLDTTYDVSSRLCRVVDAELRQQLIETIFSPSLWLDRSRWPAGITSDTYREHRLRVWIWTTWQRVKRYLSGWRTAWGARARRCSWPVSARLGRHGLLLKAWDALLPCPRRPDPQLRRLQRQGSQPGD